MEDLYWDIFRILIGKHNDVVFNIKKKYYYDLFEKESTKILTLLDDIYVFQDIREFCLGFFKQVVNEYGSFIPITLNNEYLLKLANNKVIASQVIKDIFFIKKSDKFLLANFYLYLFKNNNETFKRQGGKHFIFGDHNLCIYSGCIYLSAIIIKYFISKIYLLEEILIKKFKKNRVSAILPQ